MKKFFVSFMEIATDRLVVFVADVCAPQHAKIETSCRFVLVCEVKLSGSRKLYTVRHRTELVTGRHKCDMQRSLPGNQ